MYAFLLAFFYYKNRYQTPITGGRLMCFTTRNMPPFRDMGSAVDLTTNLIAYNLKRYLAVLRFLGRLPYIF